MNKNNLLQSLLLLSLGSAAPLCSMEYQTLSLTEEEDKLISQIFDSGSSIGEEQQPAIEEIFATEETQPSNPMQIRIDAIINLADVQTELLKNKTTLNSSKNIAQTTTSDDSWVAEATKLTERYSNLLNEITTNTVALKTPTINTPKQEEATWIEEYKKLEQQYVNFLNEIKTQKLELKTHKTNALELEQSAIATPIPTEQGFEGLMYAASFIKAKHQLIHDALISGHFNPRNETHVEYLEHALEYYVDQKKIEELMAILEISQHHLGQLDINEKTARKVHNFLELTATQKEIETKDILEKQYTQFTIEYNALVKALQEETEKRTKELHDKFHQHGIDCDKMLATQADYIRALKSGTANIHGIKPQWKRAKNETCSDKIACLSNKDKNVYMTQADVDNVYTNQQILGKIGLTSTTIDLYDNTRDNLDYIDAITNATQTIKLLTQ